MLSSLSLENKIVFVKGVLSFFHDIFFYPFFIIYFLSFFHYIFFILFSWYIFYPKNEYALFRLHEITNRYTYIWAFKFQIGGPFRLWKLVYWFFTGPQKLCDLYGTREQFNLNRMDSWSLEAEIHPIGTSNF